MDEEAGKEEEEVHSPIKGMHFIEQSIGQGGVPSVVAPSILASPQGRSHADSALVLADDVFLLDGVYVDSMGREVLLQNLLSPKP